MNALLLSILASLGGIALLIGLVYLKKAISKIKDEDIQRALLELSSVVEETIQAANQTIVKEARNDKDGTISKEDAENIKNKVRAAVKSEVSKSTRKVLEKEFTSIDNKIGTVIESKIHNEKLKTAATVIANSANIQHALTVATKAPKIKKVLDSLIK